MTDREKLIAMAREAGIETHERKGHIRFGIDCLTGEDSSAKFERFAALVRADEREACAKVAEWEACLLETPHKIAAAIRARGKL